MSTLMFVALVVVILFRGVIRFLILNAIVWVLAFLSMLFGGDQ